MVTTIFQELLPIPIKKFMALNINTLTLMPIKIGKNWDDLKQKGIKKYLKKLFYSYLRELPSLKKHF